MAAKLPDRLQAEIRRRRYDLGQTVQVVSSEMGLTRSTVHRYAPARAADIPPADAAMPEARDTLESQIAQRFGAHREPFRIGEINSAFPNRHRVLVARMVRRLVDAGVLARISHGVYVGRCAE